MVLIRSPNQAQGVRAVARDLGIAEKNATAAEAADAALACAWGSGSVKERYLSNPGPISGKKKEHKPKLLGLDMIIFRWGGGLPRERVGAEKFGMSFETQGNQTFRRDIPGFWPGYPRGALKV